MNLLAKNLLALAAVTLVHTAATAQESLALFNQNSYAGWSYTRPGFKLDTYSISMNNVKLYRSSSNVDYTLVSPAFTCAGLKTVDVDATLYCTTVPSGTYDLNRGYPTFQLLDLNGGVLASVDVVFAEAQQFHEHLPVSISVPQGTSQAKLRVAAWNADLNSTISVREVAVTANASGVAAVGADRPCVVQDGRGMITVSAPTGMPCAVYSPCGRLVARFAATGEARQLALPAGVYVLRLASTAQKVLVR